LHPVQVRTFFFFRIVHPESQNLPEGLGLAFLMTHSHEFGTRMSDWDCGRCCPGEREQHILFDNIKPYSLRVPRSCDRDRLANEVAPQLRSISNPWTHQRSGNATNTLFEKMELVLPLVKPGQNASATGHSIGQKDFKGYPTEPFGNSVHAQGFSAGVNCRFGKSVNSAENGGT
jgi:hypothetical protein